MGLIPAIAFPPVERTGKPIQTACCYIFLRTAQTLARSFARRGVSVAWGASRSRKPSSGGRLLQLRARAPVSRDRVSLFEVRPHRQPHGLMDHPGVARQFNPRWANPHRYLSSMFAKIAVGFCFFTHSSIEGTKARCSKHEPPLSP